MLRISTCRRPTSGRYTSRASQLAYRPNVLWPLLWHALARCCGPHPAVAGHSHSVSHGVTQSSRNLLSLPPVSWRRPLSMPLLWLAEGPRRGGSQGVHRYSGLAALLGAEAAKATVAARLRCHCCGSAPRWMGPPAPLAAASNHCQVWERVTPDTLPPSPWFAGTRAPVGGPGCGHARAAQAVCGGAGGEGGGEPGGPGLEFEPQAEGVGWILCPLTSPLSQPTLPTGDARVLTLYVHAF